MKTLLEINLPIPIDIASNVMNAIAEIYPGATAEPGGKTLKIWIDDSSRNDPKVLEDFKKVHSDPNGSEAQIVSFEKEKGFIISEHNTREIIEDLTENLLGSGSEKQVITFTSSDFKNYRITFEKV